MDDANTRRLILNILRFIAMNWNISMIFVKDLRSWYLRRFHAPRYNDLILRPKNIIHNGAVPLRSKAAIYLIFPKSGLLKSHVFALQYMIENGYSPIVISNLPLTDTDLDQLRPVTYRILQRENFGYDFGGYREGILVFQDQIKTLDHLALFNDSVWFPVQNTRNWLRDAEAAQKDFMGALSHADVGHSELQQEMAQLSYAPDAIKMERRRIDHPQSWLEDFSNRLMDYRQPPQFVLAVRQFIRSRRVGNGVLFHYCSFALLMGAKILRDPRFIEFWQNLKIADDWVKTIVVGEIGFTKWVIKSNFSHGSTIDTDSVAQNIARLDEAKLTHYLNNITPLRRHRAMLEAYNHNQASQKLPVMFTHPDKQHFMRAMLRMDNTAYSAPFYLFHEQKFQFFKKKNFTVNAFGRKIAMDMINDMPEPIRSEMWTVIEKTKHLDDQQQAAFKISGQRKVFGVWIGLPRLWD